MGIEIERKFLLLDDSYKKLAKGITCRQGYIYADKEKTVRVRTMDSKGFLTIKAAAPGISRLEYEYEIPYPEANELLDKICQQPLIEKVRYKVDYENFTWEVDQFFGENSGLTVAEIELDSEQQTFSKPPWVGKEVTGEPKYYNANLYKHPFSSWHR